MISKSFVKQNKNLIRVQSRSMGGGEKKPAMSPAERDFDLVIVGM